MMSPATEWPGVLYVIAVAGTWHALVRPASRIARGTLLFGLALFSPYFLLAPIIWAQTDPPHWSHALEVPWVVFFRGFSAMQVSVATATALSVTDLRQGLSRLPVPKVVSAVVHQIVHQTSSLIRETRNLAAAIGVRGGTTGYRTAIKVLGSLPKVWLPRVVDRAERVASAMELRGYAQHHCEAMGSVRMSMGDVTAVALSVAVMCGAIALRVWGVT
jgi:energy-coupling factor transporter transmembrane protein EcfT